MLYRIRLGKIPDGNTPIANQAATARRVDTGEALGQANSDSNGWVTFQADGHWPPFYIHLSNVPGGDKFWRSDESHTVGTIAPKEIPWIMRALGDGVVRGYSGMLAPSLISGGPSVSIAPGAANVAGHPVVFYGTTNLTINRPPAGTTYYTIIIRVFPEGSVFYADRAGEALLVAYQGSTTFPVLTRSVDFWEYALAQLTIPAAGAITLDDLRQFSGEPISIGDTSYSATLLTSNGSGEFFPDMELSMTMVPATTYDLTATVSTTADVEGGLGQALTTGSFGSGLVPPQFRNAQQVAVDSAGHIFVADPDNGRTTIINAAGTGASAAIIGGIVGVCVDPSDNFYLVGADANGPLGTRGWGWKFVPIGANWVVSWGWGPPTGSSGNLRHCATDGTYLFYTGKDPDSSYAFVSRRNCSDGQGAIFIDTDLVNPVGIAHYAGDIYVVDAGNNRVKVYYASAFNRLWSIPAGGAGIAIDSTGRLYITFPGENLVRRYDGYGVLQDAFTHPSPLGIGAGPGNALWVSDTAAHSLTRYDQIAPGYGSLAIDFNFQGVGTYVGIGNVNGLVQFTNTYSLGSGIGGNIGVRLSGKATSGTARFRNVVFSARAVPRG